MLEQCCNHSKQCPNNVATMCCSKNRRYGSSLVTSPLYWDFCSSKKASDNNDVYLNQMAFRVCKFYTLGTSLDNMSFIVKLELNWKQFINLKTEGGKDTNNSNRCWTTSLGSNILTWKETCHLLNEGRCLEQGSGDGKTIGPFIVMLLVWRSLKDSC